VDGAGGEHPCARGCLCALQRRRRRQQRGAGSRRTGPAGGAQHFAGACPHQPEPLHCSASAHHGLYSHQPRSRAGNAGACSAADAPRKSAHRLPVVGPFRSVLTPASKPPFRFSAQRDREALSAGDSNTAVCAGGAGDAPVDSEANQRPHAQPPAEPPAPSPRRRLPVADPEPALAPEDEDRMAAIVRRVGRARRWRESSFQFLSVSASARRVPFSRPPHAVCSHAHHSLTQRRPEARPPGPG